MFGHGAGIEALRHFGRPFRLQRPTHPIGFQICFTERARTQYLAHDVAPETMGTNAHNVLRRPACRAIVEQIELERERHATGIHEINIGIDSRRERLGDPFCIRAVGKPLAKHAAAIEEQARSAVLFHICGTQHFGKLAEPAASPGIDLPEAIACDVESLHEEGIVGLRGVDVRDAPAINENLRGSAEAGHREAFGFRLFGVCEGRMAERHGSE